MVVYKRYVVPFDLIWKLYNGTKQTWCVQRTVPVTNKQAYDIRFHRSQIYCQRLAWNSLDLCSFVEHDHNSL